MDLPEPEGPEITMGRFFWSAWLSISCVSLSCTWDESELYLLEPLWKTNGLSLTEEGWVILTTVGTSSSEADV